MEIEIFKEKLNQGLSIVEFLVKKNINLPILNNILLEVEKNFLKISATNLETSIVWNILGKVKKEGRVCLPVSLLRPLISFIKEEKIKLKAEKESLILEDNNQKNQIQGVNPEDFPVIPKIQTEDFIEIEGEKLSDGISRVVNIPSISQIRPEISGVYFALKGEKLYIVGTDSFRLAEKIMDFPQKTKKEFSFIFPQPAAKELLSILSLKKGRVKVYFNLNQIAFEWMAEDVNFPEICFSSRLIEGEYPNYKEIIPKKFTAQIVLDKDDFTNQIKKAGLFSGKISEVKLTVLPEGKIKIFSQSADIGENESFLPIKLKEKIEKETEVSFNYKFLLDGLSSIKSSEVFLGLSEEEGPAALKPIGDESFVYILMPIKNN